MFISETHIAIFHFAVIQFTDTRLQYKETQPGCSIGVAGLRPGQRGD